MSKRFILFLGLGIMMALTGIVLSSRGGLFAPAEIETSEVIRPPAGSDGTGREIKRPVFPPTAGQSVPLARIALDGRADDWAGVKVFIERGPARAGSGTYGCTAVRLARDRKHLYVLFELTRGVGETFEASRARRPDQPASPTLGMLDFDAEGRAFSLRVAAGYSVTRHAAPGAKTEPIVHVEVWGFDPRTRMLSAGSQGPAPATAFEGRTVEVALPLKTLGLIEARRVDAAFDEM